MTRKLLPLLALCLSFSYYSFAQCSAQILPAGPLTVCEGDVVTLSATPGGDNYDWIVNGALVSSGTTDNITVITSAPNTLTYVATVTFGSCTATSNAVMVTVNEKPDAPVINANSPICAGQTLSLTASTVPGATYFWESPCTAVSVFQNWTIPNITQCLAGTYTISVTANGCTSDEAYLNVTVNETPPPTVVSPLFLCQYITPPPLTANGLNLLWYNVQTGGVGMQFAPVVNTMIAGTMTYFVSQTINGCESVHAPIVVSISAACDSVWPGDVNYDLIANNDDVLDLGLSYGETGPARGTISINWSEQICQNWGLLQMSNADMKHADCNGNGTVDATDADAITQNYGMTHLKGEHVPQAKSASFPDLYFDLTGITFQAGTTVNIPIKLGTSAMQMYDVLGIAAKIKVTNVTLNNAPTISNAISWLGNSGNTIHFTKDVSTSQTDWAYVRTDHSNASGEGTIAILTMEIPADAPAQDAVLYFDNVKIINSAGDVLTDYNVVDDTATIVPVSIRSTVSTTSDRATIVPNPSDAHADLQITLSEASDVQITITDMTGRMVWNAKHVTVKGTQNIALPAALASGIYTIQAATNTGTVLPAMKWVKK